MRIVYLADAPYIHTRRWIEHFADRGWFPLGRNRLERAGCWYRKWGKWSLLLSWAPVIGDPITVAAGLLREPFPLFLLMVSVAKVGRYLLLASVTLSIL